MRNFTRLFLVAVFLITVFFLGKFIARELEKRDAKILDLQFKLDFSNEMINENQHKAFKMLKNPMIRRIMCDAR